MTNNEITIAYNLIKASSQEVRCYISMRSNLWKAVQDAMELPEFEDIDLEDPEEMCKYFPIPVEGDSNEYEEEITKAIGLDVSALHYNHDFFAMLDDVINGNIGEDYFAECVIEWLEDLQ